jgi:hypothetical protein
MAWRCCNGSDPAGTGPTACRHPHLFQLESDIQRAYQLGADGYFVNSGDPTELQGILKGIVAYWLADNRPSVDFQEFAPAVVRRPPQTLAA